MIYTKIGHLQVKKREKFKKNRKKFDSLKKEVILYALWPHLPIAAGC